nr:hypothetical protein Iba_chr08aCG4470 [Ipomoea batatas]
MPYFYSMLNSPKDRTRIMILLMRMDFQLEKWIPSREKSFFLSVSIVHAKMYNVMKSC